jgi:chromosomal replication initiation ATPase DnaA
MISYFIVPGIPNTKWTKGYKANGMSIRHQKILNVICSYFDISEEELRKKTNLQVAVYHRSVFTYFLLQMKDIPQTQIASFLNCDRSSIQYHKRLVEGQLTSRFDNDYKIDIPALTTIVSSLINK